MRRHIIWRSNWNYLDMDADTYYWTFTLELSGYGCRNISRSHLNYPDVDAETNYRTFTFKLSGCRCGCILKDVHILSIRMWIRRHITGRTHLKYPDVDAETYHGTFTFEVSGCGLKDKE